MQKKPWMALLLVIGLMGCVSAQAFRSGSGKVYTPTREDAVLVFHAAEDVQRPYEIIGEITTAGSTGWGKGEGDLIKKARKKAAEMGADAIVLKPLDKGSSGDHAMAVLFGSNDKSQRALAIKFTGPAQQLVIQRSDVPHVSPEFAPSSSSPPAPVVAAPAQSAAASAPPVSAVTVELQLTVKPWAEVVIDGQPVGTTPLRPLALAAGMHDVTFKHPTFEPLMRRLLLQPGIPMRMTIDLATEGRPVQRAPVP